ncbi:hypothetical protein K469DRAFT_711155 [Zopfia rhizophila CBS 207.26]|uniref:Uncharacterized protein n=1 Tax=Zopfia rhizophila CBS 207.26 TaxID=1314779 RepID=A0A6A6DVX3_9PEZI|nr:hypothetical protein K469DRAFT_711155 [Zopfia rhizophila CBS 207.26]
MSSSSGTSALQSTSPGIPSSTTASSSTQEPQSSTASTTQGSQHTPSSGGGGGVSGGAVAGTAIGCLIAGAAIACIVLFLLFRRQKKRQAAAYYQQHLPHNGGVPEPEKGAMAATTAASGNVDNLLPQPVEDGAITKELSRIRDNIKNHVRAYYHFDAVPATEIEESKLTDLATASGLSTSALINVILNPSTRAEAIRLFIAWVAMSRCTGERHPTLLPDELSRLAVTIAGKNGKNAAQSALFSRWKAITGALLQPRYGKQDPNAQSQSVAEAIAELDSVLAPFVKGNLDGDQRRRNLDMIISRSAQLAFLLFSQPGSFSFDFSGMGQQGLVVFPGLFQVIGDQAQMLSPPRLLLEKEVVAGIGY